jgi:hypothetical protein
MSWWNGKTDKQKILQREIFAVQDLRDTVHIQFSELADTSDTIEGALDIHKQKIIEIVGFNNRIDALIAQYEKTKGTNDE